MLFSHEAKHLVIENSPMHPALNWVMNKTIPHFYRSWKRLFSPKDFTFLDYEIWENPPHLFERQPGNKKGAC
jgi:hypothetical protein